MDRATIEQLNQINRDFYRQTASDFDQTRQSPWPGWERLLPHLTTPLSVLDAGCGNGRFGLFLYDRLGADIRYHGVDSNPELLARAGEALAARDARLELRDLIEQPLDAGDYDLVVAFGLLHHIPGLSERLAFAKALAARVRDGGLLVFTTWRFHDFAQYRARIVPWPPDAAGRVERGDYLLDWRRGQTALRYCHHTDDAEQAALIAATGLSEIESFRADGPGNAANRYSLLRRATGAAPLT